MTIKTLMAAIIFFSAINAVADSGSPDCLSFENVLSHAPTSMCNLIPAHQSENDSVSTHDANNDVVSLFHVKETKSSIAEAITVVLFIPGLILLLFSRFTKSAK